MQLHGCATASDCYRWPAIQADDYATSGALAYGSGRADIPSALRMGALLALPRSFEPSRLQTEPARALAWTLSNYGAYVVDDTAWDVWALVVENGPAGDFRQQFERDWGFPFEDASFTSPWSADMRALFTALAVIDDNGPSSVGGAGTRLQPLASDFE